MLKNKMLAVIVIVVAAALGGGIMTFAIGLPGSPCAGTTSTTHSFTIIENVNGYNDSAVHQGSWPSKPWPVMSVRQCEMVVIKNSLESRKGQGVPDWLELRTEQLSGRVLHVPTRASIGVPINEQLIVELYSK